MDKQQNSRMKTADCNQDPGLINSFKSLLNFKKANHNIVFIYWERKMLYLHIEKSYENAQLQLANDTLTNMTNKTPFFWTHARQETHSAIDPKAATKG